MATESSNTIVYVREVRAVYESKIRANPDLNGNPTLRSPEQVAEFVRKILPDNTQEHFFVLNLIICGHNHPSGSLAPSEDDRKIHDRLVECSKLLGVALLDNLIVTDSSHHSLLNH